MGRFIVFIVLILGVYFLYKKFSKEKVENSNIDVIKCDECGVFVDKKEIKLKNGKQICKECYDNFR